MVQFLAKVTSNMPVNVEFATVPSGYRPKDYKYPLTCIYRVSSDTDVYNNVMRINTDGTIKQGITALMQVGSIIEATYLYALD